jgi:hypothetical protein
VLPFLKRNQSSVAGLIIKNRTPDEKPADESEKTEENQEHDEAIRACAQDLIRSVHAHDVKGVADAMRSAFEILETLPHEEVDHSYDAQNELAADEE